MENRKLTYRLFLLFIGLYLPIAILAQVNYPAEKVELWPDRYLFISGETIQFSGVINAGQDEITLSKVVYVELIAPTGQKISQSKFIIESDCFEGELPISPDVLSGYYVLRAYSKWMRNGDPNDYANILLKVVNPYTDEVLLVNDLQLDTNIAMIENKVNALTIEKNNFKPREQIQFEIDRSILKNDIKTSISIVPAISTPFEKRNNSNKDKTYNKVDFYPEIRGISLSGQVVSAKDRSLLPYHKVNIHLEKETDFIAVLSDSSGRFHIALPERYGSIELILIAASHQNIEVEILVDQDYCNKEVSFKSPLFKVGKDEKSQLLKMAQTLQLNRLYQQNDSLVIDSIYSRPFYGSQFKTISFDSFVKLDSLAQYFSDLPSWVRVRDAKGQRKIVINGINSDLQLYDPLILIDWVPVDDVERILDIDPARIKEFDVVITPYIHGGITYGGILSIFTRKSDFGGMEFPKSGMYINYGFYDLSQKSTGTIKQDNSFNNTSTWITNTVKDPDLSSVNISAPSVEGKYIILLQSVNEKGIFSTEWIAFEVN